MLCFRSRGFGYPGAGVIYIAGWPLATGSWAAVIVDSISHSGDVDCQWHILIVVLSFCITGTMNVLFILPGREPLNLQVRKGDTIATIKLLVHNATGIPMDVFNDLRLYGTTELLDHMTVDCMYLQCAGDGTGL